MRIFLLLFFFISFASLAQNTVELTPEERAYLFHIVKKSQILDTSMGRYFDYKGPMIKYPNKSINYDSIESLMITNPSLLVIRTEEINKTEKGVVLEAANKTALWEFNRCLHFQREGGPAFDPYKAEYDKFVEVLIKYLPTNALTRKNGTVVPNKKLDNLSNPSLSIDDRIAFLGSFQFLDENDRMVTLKGFNQGITEYVQKRTLEIFTALGGEASVLQNVLIAAGDGSSSGGEESREKDEKGRWTDGLPKAVGLFPYQTQLTVPERKVEPLLFNESDYKTVGENKNTNLHFDVWSYNKEKQTTVVIEKHGLTYHLFSSGENRFLSPDSSFINGNTFQSMINDLEFVRIAKLKDMIYGKRGYDYQIKDNTKKKDKTELLIEKHEKKYSDFGYKPIVTKNKMSRKTKKQKKNAAPGKQIDYQPITDSQKDVRKDEQNSIVGLYGQYDFYKREIERLKKEKEECIDILARYQRRLETYKQLIGTHWATYKEKDGIYMFQDSSTFDMMTQEFHFKADSIREDFEVRVLAIPENCLSDLADEVMLHMSLVDATPHYDARLRIELNDVFASDKWDLARPLFDKEDSVAVRQFFEEMLNKKAPFTIVAKGQGIGLWNGSRTVKNPKPVEQLAYKGSKMDTTYLRLRKSELFINLEKHIQIEVNSYTDPVTSNLQVQNATLTALMAKYKLSKNDILSVYRTATLLKKLKQEINTLAPLYLDKDKSKAVLSRFNKEMAKAKIIVGKTSVKLSELDK